MFNPTANLSIRNMNGDYKPLNLFQFFDNGVRKRLPRRLAHEFKDEVIKNINQNTFGFQLSRRWLRYKELAGADHRPYIMFKHYRDAISIITVDGHLSVGFKKSEMHPRARMSMGQLAMKLEYGDALNGIPARPIWRKSAEKFFREQKAKQIVESILQALNEGIK